MKKVTGVILSILLSSTVVLAQAATDDGGTRTLEQKLALVKKMASYQIGENVRMSQPVVSKEGICGAEGPSILVNLQIKHSVRYMDKKTQEIKMKSVWKTIKTFGATSSELDPISPYSPSLMDSENCME